MKYKMIRNMILVVILLIIGVFVVSKYNNNDKVETRFIEGTIITRTNNTITLKDDNNVIYTFNYEEDKADIGDTILLEYTGELDHIKEIQDSEVVSTKIVTAAEKTTTSTTTTSTTSEVTSSTTSSSTTSTKKSTTKTTTTKKQSTDITISSFDSNGIFGKYYDKAMNKVKSMTLEDKIKQVLLIHYNNAYVSGVGGYIFFGKDFKNKTESEIKKMISDLQDKTKIPFLIAVDEEGGTVVRVSSNTNLRSSKFKSPKEIYDANGMKGIRSDTIEKSNFLRRFGINLNLAPVVDIADKTTAYMYKRTIGYGKDITSDFARTVIIASKDSGVSYCLKHFPGYGNNDDTHIASATDMRSYDDLMNNDIIPFKEGIDNGAEAVMVSHNIISSVDKNNPASLSSGVHNILTKDLSFTGVVITDDLDMGATKNISKKYIKALKAGNDLLIITDYNSAIKEIKSAIENKELSESVINNAAAKIIAWKYYKGLL